MNSDVVKLEEKIKNLEESIKEFENNHNKQLNNLIELFSDVIDIIKNREIKEDNKEKEIEPLTDTLDDLKDENFDEVKIVNNEFYGKSPKEIVDYIIDNIKKDSNSNENKEEKEEIISQNIEPVKIEPIKINEETKSQENKVEPKEEIKPIKINFDELKMEEITPVDTKDTLNEVYKIEKAFSPVEVWINTFKNTKKYKDIKNKINSYGILGDINSVEPKNNKIRLSAIIKLKPNTKLYTSQNLDIESGILEGKGYDKDSTFMVMSINYVDDLTNEKTTFDLYNCKTNEERHAMINAENKFLEENKGVKVNDFCIPSQNGEKIGWTTLESLNNIIIDETELL